MLPLLVVLAAVQVGVGTEHAHELPDGLVDHGPVVPAGGLHCLAAQALEAAVEPVHDGQVGLPDPAVAPDALHKRHGPAVAHDVVHQHAVVIQPDAVEVVHRVLETAPFPVLIQAGLGQVQLAELALPVGLAVPEVPGKLLYLFNVHLHLPSCIFFISMLSIKAWNRVRSWPEALFMYSFSMEQTGMPKSLLSTMVFIVRS